MMDFPPSIVPEPMTSMTPLVKLMINLSVPIHSGSAFRSTTHVATKMTAQFTSMHPNDQDNQPSDQVPIDLAKDKVETPSKTVSNDSPYKTALKT